MIKTDDIVKEQCHPLAIASIVIHTDFIPIYVCRSYHMGITTIPKNGMLGVTIDTIHGTGLETAHAHPKNCVQPVFGGEIM